MEDGSLPSYLFTALIILIMVFNGLVVACKRALDYIDRNVIKDMLEDEPENKRLHETDVQTKQAFRQNKAGCPFKGAGFYSAVK